MQDRHEAAFRESNREMRRLFGVALLEGQHFAAIHQRVQKLFVVFHPPAWPPAQEWNSDIFTNATAALHGVFGGLLSAAMRLTHLRAHANVQAA
jgi:hypothetical protein